MKKLIALATLFAATPAAAWDVHGSTANPNTGESIPISYATRTTVVELLFDAGMEATSISDHVARELYVRFADGVGGLCPNRRYMPRTINRRLVGDMAVRNLDYVYVGPASDASVKSLLAQLMTLKATGNEVEVVIDSANCRLAAVRAP